MRLLVRQSGRVVGVLESTPDKGVVFQYNRDYLVDKDARPLSLSLPLRELPYSQAASMPFFAGLLPDGELRRRVADYLHLSETSTLKLLDALGGECAGTVSILREDGDDVASAGSTGEPRQDEYKELSEEELSSLVRESYRRPLLASHDGARLSLAGAQDKIPLLYREGRWFLPIGDSPSSHILKPTSPAFADLVANEFFCMRLAYALGLSVPRVEIVEVGRPVLLVRRYDREVSEEGRITRVHQEDFCQALGIMPDRKYEVDGGPGFASIAALIRRASSNPLRDIASIMRIALFNLLVGNCDAHGKNFSLVYKGRSVSLSPFYDLVSTMAYPELAPKLSMRMGGEYRVDKIGRFELEGFAKDLGVQPRIVRDTAAELAGSGRDACAATATLPELRSYAQLVDSIVAGWAIRAQKIVGPM
jgi:serine/threonine-protein kinase HipA